MYHQVHQRYQAKDTKHTKKKANKTLKLVATKVWKFSSCMEWLTNLGIIKKSYAFTFWISGEMKFDLKKSRQKLKRKM